VIAGQADRSVTFIGQGRPSANQAGPPKVCSNLAYFFTDVAPVIEGQAGRSVTFVDEDDRKLVKEIVKQNQGKVQERVVPAASLKKWANQVEQMGGDIERLILVSPPPLFW